ncbi:MAG: metallophosphoesterase [Deltaproteobacteria bacterium]|nr:metallophosphoesterase [Deltaproteobacteria bacterium]
MRTAVISDIHGNLEALNQVLEDIAQAQIDFLICLGDCIGYGPEPEEVVQALRSRAIPCILGNHELGLLDPSYRKWFNPPTRTSLRLTRKLLSAASLNYFKELPPFAVHRNCRYVHGFPPDSVTTYLYEVPEAEIQRLLTALPERICFIGHTHDLHLIAVQAGGIEYRPASRGIVFLEADKKYLINSGSVGQPRDGTNHAKYVIWDDEASTLEIRFVAYDIARTAEKILSLGFPAYNAERLW